MKKALLLVFLFCVGVSLSAQEVNVVTHDNKIVKGELVGKLENSLLINTNNGLLEIHLKDIKHVFNAKTGEKLELTASPSTPLPPSAPPSAAKEKTDPPLYTVEKQEEYVVLRRGTLDNSKSVFKRSTNDYVDLDLQLAWSYPIFITESTEKLLKDSEVSFGHFLFPAFFYNTSLLVRPFDFLALGMYYNVQMCIIEYDKTNLDTALNIFSSGIASKFYLNSKLKREENTGQKYEESYFLLVHLGYAFMSWDEKFINAQSYTKVALLGFGYSFKVLNLFYGFRYCYFDDLKYSKALADPIKDKIPRYFNANTFLIAIGINL